MSAIDYLRYVTLIEIKSGSFDKLVSRKWISLDEMRRLFADRTEVIIEKFGHNVGARYDFIGEEIFDALVESGAIKTMGDDLTGLHGWLEVDAKDDLATALMTELPVFKTIESLGSDVLGTVIDRISRAEKWSDEADAQALTDEITSWQATEVPASDRVVTLQHNQSAELELKLDEVIDSISTQNQIGDSVGLRELVLGQMKAGRELLRNGTFKVFILKVTLIDTLSYLSKRYEKEAIGALASALMTALLAAIGLTA